MSSATRSRTRRRARRQAGFTLIELSIALVAGLMVAVAVMGISKEATTTFHEEVRVSAAEMALRIAMERIRLDLQRAAFMGTGNLQGDPLVARVANVSSTTPNPTNFQGVAPHALANLSGIALHSGGASANTDSVAGPQLVLNNLAPDSIDIAGNMSTSDEYAAAVVWNPPGGNGNCQSGQTGAALSIQMTTPDGWRIRNASNPALALQAAFQPGSNANAQYLIKLTDSTGRTQYLLTCVGQATSYSALTNPPTAMVYLDPRTTVLTTAQTGGNGGVGGFAAGWVTVSPLEITRWDIMSPTQLAALPTTGATSSYSNYIYSATANTMVDTANPDLLLTRSYLDLATGNVEPTTLEVVAEYAIDMKFGLTVDQFAACTTGFPCPTSPPTYTSNPLVHLAMDSLTSGNPSSYAAQVGAYVPNVGPQRIRDVQVRLGIRGMFGDRAANLVPPPSSAVSPSYLLRFRGTYPSPPGSVQSFPPATPYARVRELTTEVNLPNQGRFYY